MAEGNTNPETLESRAAKAQEMIDEGNRTKDLALVENGKMLLASLGDPDALPSDYYKNLPADAKTNTEIEQNSINKLINDANEESRKKESFPPHQPIINAPPNEKPVQIPSRKQTPKAA